MKKKIPIKIPDLVPPYSDSSGSQSESESTADTEELLYMEEMSITSSSEEDSSSDDSDSSMSSGSQRGPPDLILNLTAVGDSNTDYTTLWVDGTINVSRIMSNEQKESLEENKNNLDCDNVGNNPKANEDDTKYEDTINRERNLKKKQTSLPEDASGGKKMKLDLDEDSKNCQLYLGEETSAISMQFDVTKSSEDDKNAKEEVNKVATTGEGGAGDVNPNNDTVPVGNPSKKPRIATDEDKPTLWENLGDRGDNLV